MDTIDSPFKHTFWIEITGVEWSPLESIWTERGTEKYCHEHVVEMIQ